MLAVAVACSHATYRASRSLLAAGEGGGGSEVWQLFCGLWAADVFVKCLSQGITVDDTRNPESPIKEYTIIPIV